MGIRDVVQRSSGQLLLGFSREAVSNRPFSAEQDRLLHPILTIFSIELEQQKVFFVGGIVTKARMTAIQTRVDELQLQVNEDRNALYFGVYIMYFSNTYCGSLKKIHRITTAVY